jgi:class 3 adenylate cyclase
MMRYAMAHTWNYDRAVAHIKRKIDDVLEIEIVEYTRDLSLENIPANKAYLMNGVHLYADILNIDDMLNTTKIEGEICHKRTLRFLNLHYRAVRRILTRCEARRVDFHNQRLHVIVTKPYETEKYAEAKRVRRAVAVGQLIVDVLAETGDDDESIPNAKVRVGIDTGRAFAVNNGRNGGREPLFLGEPANQAAKLSGGGQVRGIFLTNDAREAIGLLAVDEPKDTSLTRVEVKACQEESDLGVTKEEIVQEWREDLKSNPIGGFEFSRHTPPLRTLDIASLTPLNSRRQEAISVYADLDGFTAYVRSHLEKKPKDVVRALHVIRAELDRVLSSEFDGRRIRFIGDCIHGLLCEGNSKVTEASETVSTAAMCAGAMRSSFELALEKLAEHNIDADGLGLAIGIEYGPMTVTRLGMQGDRVRCSVSRGVLISEREQARCNGAETAIGEVAYSTGSDPVQRLFGARRKGAKLDYSEVVEALAAGNDETARASKRAAFAPASPAVARSADISIRPHLARR